MQFGEAVEAGQGPSSNTNSTAGYFTRIEVPCVGIDIKRFLAVQRFPFGITGRLVIVPLNQVDLVVLVF